MANNRNMKLAHRYTSVLMREKEVKTSEMLRVDSNEMEMEMPSEASLFETKGSQDRDAVTLAPGGVSAPDLVEKLMMVQNSPKETGELELSVIDSKKVKTENPLSITMEVDEAAILEVLDNQE